MGCRFEKLNSVTINEYELYVLASPSHKIAHLPDEHAQLFIKKVGLKLNDQTKLRD